MILVLANGNRYQIEDYGHLGHMVHIASSENAGLALIHQITPANLAHVILYNDDGETLLAEYTDLVTIAPPTMQPEQDETGELTGRVLVTIALREKTDIEVRLDALEESQTLQDGAIEDIADVVSELAEG